MRISQCILVVADISGYTKFVTHRAVSLKHAEQIVTELMESIIDGAELPLTVNKLEGDAALLFAETGNSMSDACGSILQQVHALHAGFDRQVRRIRTERRHCECDACSNVSNLKLKFIVHVDQIAIKQVRQFEELAGEGVILIHRLLKNSLDLREYIAMTREFHEALGPLAPDGDWHTEDVEGVGQRQIFVCAPRTGESGADGEASAGAGPLQRPRTTGLVFHNLPEGERGFVPWLRDAVALSAIAVGSTVREWTSGRRNRDD